MTKEEIHQIASGSSMAWVGVGRREWAKIQMEEPKEHTVNKADVIVALRTQMNQG